MEKSEGWVDRYDSPLVHKALTLFLQVIVCGKCHPWAMTGKAYADGRTLFPCSGSLPMHCAWQCWVYYRMLNIIRFFFMKIGKNVTYCYCYCNYRLPSRCYGASARKTAYFPFDIAYQIIFPHALKTVSLQPYFSRLHVLLHQL